MPVPKRCLSLLLAMVVSGCATAALRRAAPRVDVTMALRPVATVQVDPLPEGVALVFTPAGAEPAVVRERVKALEDVLRRDKRALGGMTSLADLQTSLRLDEVGQQVRLSFLTNDQDLVPVLRKRVADYAERLRQTERPAATGESDWLPAPKAELVLGD